MYNNIFKLVAVSAIAIGVSAVNIEAVQAEEVEDSLSVRRIQGENRFETATLISSDTYDTSNTVIIANAREFADALAGVPLAYQKDAPILLAQGNSLNRATVNEIERLGAKEVIILGGEIAVSSYIERELQNLGLRINRIAGNNRFETAELIADELKLYVSSDKAVVVDGFEFADAMSVAPFAAQEGMPIYLTRTNSLVSEKALEEFSQTYIIGGTAAISKTVENDMNNPTRLEGPNRYATNLAVMEYFGVNSDHLFVSTGLDFVDALTGAVFAASESAGVALVRNGIHDDLNKFIKEHSFDQFTVLGGQIAVPQEVTNSLVHYLETKERTVLETVIENEISFNRIETENNQLPLGEIITHQVGANGYDEVEYEVTYVNGQSISRNELSRLTVKPIDEIVEVGTKVTLTKEESIIENVLEFNIVEIEDNTLPVGLQEVVQEGQDGYDEVIYEVTYINDVETDRKEVNRITIDPVDKIINIGTMELTDSRTALNGLTVQLTNILYVEGDEYNTFTISYKETNNTDQRIDQESFKLYFTDGSNQTQYGFFNRLMPGDSTERTYRFNLLKTEEPSILEYGDVFFNTVPADENITWDVSSVELN